MIGKLTEWIKFSKLVNGILSMKKSLNDKFTLGLGKSIFNVTLKWLDNIVNYFNMRLNKKNCLNIKEKLIGEMLMEGVM